VPVTTTPAPLTVNERSIHIRNGPPTCSSARPTADARCSTRLSSFDLVHDLEGRQFNGVIVDEIDARKGDHADLRVEQVEHRRMFLGLWHPSAVGSNHQESTIDGSDAGKHVLDETLMTWDVNESNIDSVEVGPGEPEIDCQAPLLLGGPTVWIPACDRLNEGRLAVVDVACCSDDGHVSSEPSGWLRQRGHRHPGERSVDR